MCCTTVCVLSAFVSAKIIHCSLPRSAKRVSELSIPSDWQVRDREGVWETEGERNEGWQVEEGAVRGVSDRSCGNREVWRHQREKGGQQGGAAKGWFIIYDAHKRSFQNGAHAQYTLHLHYVSLVLGFPAISQVTPKPPFLHLPPRSSTNG